jgi:hypothetical protein
MILPIALAPEVLEVIDTDRPHQTDTPHVVPRGRSQFETAVVSVSAGGPTLKGPHVGFLDIAYKFGVLRDTDVQMIFRHMDWDTERRRFAPPGPLNLRAKLALVHQDGFVPSITFVPTVFLPFAPGVPVRGGILAFWGWELPHGIEIEMNAGWLAGAPPKPPIVAVLATAVTMRVVGRLKAFVDVYATGWDIAMGTGLVYPMTNDMQLDAGTYIGLNGDVPAATPFLGFSFRR